MFKEASVTPIMKTAGLDEDIPSNYTPISNLNNISKLSERLFPSRLQLQIIRSLNFSHLQSPSHSTEIALLTLNYIYKAALDSIPTILFSLDLSAAVLLENRHSYDLPN
jgi:hypothetical protein